MLGFGKKKKEEKNDNYEEAIEEVEKSSSKEEGPEKKEKKSKKKKRFSIKKILIILFVLLAIGGSAYVVYAFYFSGGSGEDKKAVYKQITLEHVNLPQEMLQFSFEYLPDLYSAMITYNKEITLINSEISRIENIAQTYPDQKKIADKEKKIWEKTKSTLQKGFLKIEKPVKETYVLFRVNQASGLVRVEEKYPELTQLAQDTLLKAQEQTEKIKSKEAAPEGLIKGNIYKLKKKFL